MDQIELIASAVAGGVVFLSTVVGFIISLIKSIKNARRANQEKATNEIEKLTISKVLDIEKLYSQASKILHSAGLKTGEIKKENVMNYIEAQCNEKKIDFDKDYWSNQIEELIKVMNVNKGA